MSTSSSESKGSSNDYDGLGRVTSTITPVSSASYSYKVGNKVSVTDGRGYTTTNFSTGYGSSNNSFLVKTESPSLLVKPESPFLSRSLIFDPGTPVGNSPIDPITTTLTKNKVGKLLSVTQDTKTITYGYHSTYKNYITSEAHPSFTITYDRDAAGNMTSRKVGNSSTTSYAYDGNSRLTNINYPAGTADVTFTYLKSGEMLTATNGVGDITFDYDELGRMLDRDVTIDNTTYYFHCEYDDNGNLSSMTYADGTVVSYSPNMFGEAKQVSGYASSVVSHPTGAIKSFTYNNGLTYTGNVDSSKVRLGSIYLKNGSSYLVKKEYNYDANSNVSDIKDTVKSSHAVKSFSYDAVDRLLGASSASWGGGGATSFTYDKLGNIETKVESGVTSNYHYDSNNLLNSISGGSKNYAFEYDTYGNVTNNGHHNFVYNDAGQLKSAVGGNVSKSFEYDAIGNRVKATTNGSTDIEIYNGTQLIWVKEPSGTEIKKVYLGNKLIGQQRGSTKSFMHFDALGSVIAKSDINKSIVYEHYRPFGEKVEKPSGTNNAQWYTGKQFDDELDIVYMQARYYDPVVGRFYSNDPVGFTGDITTFNRYSYVGNNPYKYTDPTGMFRDCASDSNCTTIIGSYSDFYGDEFGAPARYKKGLKDKDGKPQDGEITCDARCESIAKLIVSNHLAIMRLRADMNYRQTQGMIAAAIPMFMPLVLEGGAIGAIAAKQNAAAALIATNLMSTVLGDLATITAFAVGRSLPHISQSLLKTGRWGKPRTKSLHKKKTLTH